MFWVNEPYCNQNSNVLACSPCSTGLYELLREICGHSDLARFSDCFYLRPKFTYVKHSVLWAFVELASFFEQLCRHLGFEGMENV